MACTQPLRAWQPPGGGAVRFLAPEVRKPDTRYMLLPCGLCLSCRLAKGRDWAIRCQLELQQHSRACWVTLTYEDKYLPPTLRKSDLSGFLKRVRSRQTTTGSVRFFGCGEYGERNGRPHYHAILYGISDVDVITSCWRQGHVRVDQLSPAAIAYVAGYTSKKASQHRYYSQQECVDQETGEVYVHQDPFILMSRRPGIGANAKQYWRSWRRHAIWHGREAPVPRYLHQAWLDHASPAEVEALRIEKEQHFLLTDTTPQMRRAAAEIAIAKHHRQATRREL